MNIFTILEMAADTMPDRVAVTNGDTNLTYLDLMGLVRGAASLIAAQGCSRVAYLGRSSPAALVALFAAALTGKPYVPLNYRLTASEIGGLLERLDAALLVGEAETLQAAGVIASGAAGIVQVLDTQSFLSAAKASPAWEGDAPDEAGSVAVELFTSGTTGAPKAAILRHDNLMSYIIGTVEFMGAEEDSSTLTAVPPYHIAGISAVLSSFYSGRRMVQLPDFSVADWLDLVGRERVSHAFLVPTMLQRIVQHVDDAAATLHFPALRALAYGGGRMPIKVVERAMDLFPNADFTNAYGLTETSSTICLLAPDDHRAAITSDDPAVRRRLGSVGRALPTIELVVRDEDGLVLPAGEAGLVFVRGDQVAGDYRGGNSQVDGQGWFATRDRGWLDDEGYLFLDGRADDVIVRGGENISPGEIEDVLLAHPAVAEVAVVAIPDVEWGEAVAAEIVLKAPDGVSVEELQNHVRGALRSSRVPQAIRFVEALPYNDTGKLLRRVVKQNFADVAG